MQDYPNFTKAEMAGKYLCQQAASSTSATIEQCLHRARLLRQAGEEPDNPKINFPQELLHYAMKLGCHSQESKYKTAVNLANLIITDIRRERREPSKIASTLAPEQRKILWQKLNLMPGGANAEIAFLLKNCSSDMDISKGLLSGIRMGIINHYNGNFCLEIMEDILAVPSLEGTNEDEPLISVDRLLKGEVRGIIINIYPSEAQDDSEIDIYRLGLELVKDNIVIKNWSHHRLANLIQSAVKTSEELNIDTHQLPIIIRILDYHKETFIADYCSLLAFGWLIHIPATSEMIGSKMVLKTINDTFANLSLGKIMTESDFHKTLRLYKDHIEKKRASLGLS